MGLGFVSGFNLAFMSSTAAAFPNSHPSDPLQGMDIDAVLKWVDGYCQAHPQEKLGNAVMQLFQR
jgi:hypothetical protein